MCAESCIWSRPSTNNVFFPTAIGWMLVMHKWYKTEFEHPPMTNVQHYKYKRLIIFTMRKSLLLRTCTESCIWSGHSTNNDIFHCCLLLHTNWPKQNGSCSRDSFMSVQASKRRWSTLCTTYFIKDFHSAKVTFGPVTRQIMAFSTVASSCTQTEQTKLILFPWPVDAGSSK